jgi:Tol biopolymer transport system component
MTTTLISSTATNVVGNSISNQATLSQNGQYAVFASDAQNLSTQAYGQNLIYLKNTLTGALKLVSTTTTGFEANSNSYQPDISNDGRFVLFSSYADNLFANDNNNDSDVFIKDTSTNALKLISGIGTQVGDGWSGNADMTRDGLYVVFESQASNLITTDFNGTNDIYLKNVSTGAVTLVSQTVDGIQTDWDSFNPVISDNGRYVAFSSDASNLIANDTNDNRDVFLKDMQTGTVTLISSNSNGDSAYGWSDNPAISADGSQIAFSSYATDLYYSTNDAGYASVYVKDWTTGMIKLLTVGYDGQSIDGNSWDVTISPDGKTVAFVSDATNLVIGDANNAADVFVVKVDTGEIVRLAENTNLGDSETPSFSGDNATISFSRWNSNSATDPSNSENVYTTANPFSISTTPSAGNDLLTGTAGNDTIDGLAGADTMTGGLGNDTYTVDNTGDVVIETSTLATEIDTVKSSITYTLAANVENLTLIGTAAINGTGNGLKNTLTGNAKANVLNGGAGNDILIGGAGKDKLTGSTGADVFKFAAVTETGITVTTRDTIVDFKHAQADKIDLSAIDANTSTAGNQAFSFIGATAFSTTNAAGQLRFDAASHILYGSNDADIAPEFSILLTGVSALAVADFVL